MAKRAIEIYVPEDVERLLPRGRRVTPEEALIAVLTHAKGTLAITDEERMRLHAEWANTSVVVFVREEDTASPPSRG